MKYIEPMQLLRLAAAAVWSQEVTPALFSIAIDRTGVKGSGLVLSYDNARRDPIARALTRFGREDHLVTAHEEYQALGNDDCAATSLSGTVFGPPGQEGAHRDPRSRGPWLATR